jgi:hypothetical protein
MVSAESKQEYNNMLLQKKANPVLNPLKNSGSDLWGYSGLTMLSRDNLYLAGYFNNWYKLSTWN